MSVGLPWRLPRCVVAAGLLALPLAPRADPERAPDLVCPSFSPTVSTTAPGAASPEAAWRKIREAFRVGDFRTYVEGLSPATRGECICEIFRFIAMAHHGELGETDLTELNVILRRQGLDELREAPDPPDTKRLTMREAVARVRDPAAFYAEGMRFLARRRMGWSCGAVPCWLRFDPEALRFESHRATATHAVVGTVTFDRLAGAWFVRSPMNCIRDLDGVGRKRP